MKKPLLAGLLLLLLAAVPAWAASAADIEWMSSLPGVAQMTSTATPHTLTRTYSVGDPTSVFQALRSGLARRGWQIASSPQVTAAGTYVGAFVAHKSGATLRIQTSAVSGIGGTMTVVLHDGADDGTLGEAAPDEGGAVEGDGGSVTINNSNVRRTLNVNGHLTVNGSNCRLIVHGNCDRLTLNASECQITIEGRLGKATLNGSGNTLIWSRSGNEGRSPKIVDNGSDNQVRMR
jgi:hypothetical protein